jgi:hypothetical protein
MKKLLKSNRFIIKIYDIKYFYLKKFIYNTLVESGDIFHWSGS